jgi:hypothetical protein
VSGFERRATSLPVIAGWAVAVGGGVLLVASGFMGGWTVTLAGTAVAVAGFAIVGVGLRRTVPLSATSPIHPAVAPARSERSRPPREAAPRPAAPRSGMTVPPLLSDPSISAAVLFATTPERPWDETPAAPMALSLFSAREDPMPPEPATPAKPASPGPAAEPRPPAWTLGPSLPFAAAATSRSQAMAGPSSPEEPWPPAGRFSRNDLLEEVDRLRHQVEELSPPVLVPGLSVLPSTPMADELGLVTRVPEPPASHLGPRYALACVGCGDPAPPGPTGESRCWGCGRAVCTTCFWKYGPGPGLHRCGDCVASTGSSSFSVSGGRASVRRPGGFPSSEESEWTEGL